MRLKTSNSAFKSTGTSLFSRPGAVSVVRKAENYQKPAEPAIPAAYSSGAVADLITREVFAFPVRNKTP